MNAWGGGGGGDLFTFIGLSTKQRYTLAKVNRLLLLAIISLASTSHPEVVCNGMHTNLQHV